MRRTRLAAAILAAAVLAAACTTGGDEGEGTAPPGPGSEVVQVASPLDRSDPDLDPRSPEVAAVVDGDTAFALDLYRELLATDPSSNLFLSPYSISLALAMTLAGARGDTRAEMAAVLGEAGEDWHAARNALDRWLRAERPAVDDLTPLRLEITNRLWGQAGYPFIQDFLDLLARQYGAGLSLVDFRDHAEEARRAVNAWVEEATEGRIAELIPEGAVDELTRLVLVNAIYFKASWLTRFDPELTAPASFTTAEGESVTAEMMRINELFLYAEGDGWQAARLPYVGDASMIVILPEAGRFEEIAASLDPLLLAEIRASFETRSLELALPRFEVRSQLSLDDALRALGMVEVFEAPGSTRGADLTGMVEVRELYVTDVIHEAFVAVDEQGTEAAAATAVIIGVTSAPLPATLILDRPFIFLIQDDASGSVIFLGHLADPTA